MIKFQRKADNLLLSENLLMYFCLYRPISVSKSTNALTLNVVKAVCYQKVRFIHILSRVLMEYYESKQAY